MPTPLRRFYRKRRVKRAGLLAGAAALAHRGSRRRLAAFGNAKLASAVYRANRRFPHATMAALRKGTSILSTGRTLLGALRGL